jgi:RNA polymerase sigma-70 factor (ECF subfamily)
VHSVLGVEQTAIVPSGLAVPVDPPGREGAYRDDVALIRGVVEGDRKAQEKLVLRVLPTLRAVARTLLRSHADADDAVQVTLMKILKAAKDYRAEGSLERWARRIGVRTCIRIAKQERRHRQSVDSGTELADVPANIAGPRLAERLPHEVMHYLSRLPDAQREAILLRHGMDYSVVEIAELVAAPVDTVKSRLLFGRRALRKLVRQDLAISEVNKARPTNEASTTDEKKHA